MPRYDKGVSSVVYTGGGGVCTIVLFVTVVVRNVVMLVFKSCSVIVSGVVLILLCI